VVLKRSIAVEITVGVVPSGSSRDHRNPVVQLEHLDLTARGLPLLEGGMAVSRIDGSESRSNYHPISPASFGGFL
jgi:hypothetical protein